MEKKVKEHHILSDNPVFRLNTKNTSYIFRVLPTGHLEHLYYGERVKFQEEYDAIFPKIEFVEGNLNVYDESTPNLGLENRCLEFSTKGKSDIREPFVEVVYKNGSRTSDFIYVSHMIKKKHELNHLPSSYDEVGHEETLVIVLKDKNYDVELRLFYSLFYHTDVIVRSSELYNRGEESIEVERLLSCQLDFDDSDYVFTTFEGAWAREMEKKDSKCSAGITINDSKTGSSSNRRNPFVMLSKAGTTEDHGPCYACNLIYSGNHYEAVEVNSYYATHFVAGINPFNFSYHLKKGETFEAPEAVLTYSSRGFSGVSKQMHRFVKEHVVRGVWKKKERPILVNSWEAMYFNFSEKKLIKLAKAAKKVGVELFVLDDGWFGQRNDDTSSLGDWDVNKKKLPNGLAGLAEKINELGMDFGIWVEPEMISRNSECYRKHPEYAIEIPGQAQAIGRHQLVLDLTKTEVQNYIIAEMKKVFSSANITYVKWDMNRIISDAFSTGLDANSQGEFYHRYILGLYRVLKELTETFPKILFESCASGGNRFDLGMLCYMPQVWASDNTDAICRAEIQTGYSYGYPQSVIGAHVSGVPNHQTLRKTSLDTRFQVACFGLLGYECNLRDMNDEQLEQIGEQIKWYKSYRSTLQFGEFHRITSGERGIYKWMIVDSAKDEAVGLYLQKEVKANYITGNFKTKGLDDEAMYHVSNRPLIFNIKEMGDLINQIMPIHIKQDGVLHNMIANSRQLESEVEDYRVSGSALNKVGLRLCQGFGGTGYNERVRHFPDFASRIYIMKRED